MADIHSSYHIYSPVEASDWYYADTTQRLANHLPEWSKVRKLKHSVGQTFLNGIAGVPLQEAENSVELGLRQDFTVTYPLDTLDVVKKAELPEWVSTDSPTTRMNKVPNSSFEIHTNPAMLPDGWLKNGVITKTTGLEGFTAMRLSVNTGGTVSLYRDIEERLKANEVWIASIWYKISDNSLTAPASDHGIKITATHVDGTTTTTHGVVEATTDDEWLRKSLTLTYNLEVTKLRFEIITKDTATFAFAGNTFDVDCVQLEQGGRSSPWRPDTLDTLPYLQTTTRTGVYVAGSSAAHFVDNLQDFWYESFPTRASYVSSEAGSFESVQTAGSVLVTDYSKQTWKFLFENNSPYVRRRGSDVPGDVIQDHGIRALGWDGYIWPVLNPYIEALTYFADFLWVVLREVDPNGTTVRTLRVLNPRTPHPEPNYLESVAGVQLPSDIPIGASIVRVEFKYEDRQHIYLSTTTTQYTVRLHYDLFMVDAASRNIYFREDLSSVSLV